MSNYQLILPQEGPKPSYYKSYVGYFESIFPKKYTTILYQGQAFFNYFIFEINGRKSVVDFDNFHTIKNEYIDKNLPYFKFQYSKHKHGFLSNVKSYTKISFFDWNRFFVLRNVIKYTCNSDIIINMQKPRGAAIDRRNYVQTMLKKEYDRNVKTNFVKNQEEFWHTINNCLVHVCVPGARHDILDRGQVQAMAFGCCTVSPYISDCLAWNKELIPNEHYVMCKSDYSDLIEKIEWCKKNRKECIRIGNNVKFLFNETSVPTKLWEWIIKSVF